MGSVLGKTPGSAPLSAPLRLRSELKAEFENEKSRERSGAELENENGDSQRREAERSHKFMVLGAGSLYWL